MMCVRMRNAHLLLLLIIALALPSHAADVRLARNITYPGGYKRLHAVAEDLSKQTGVAIYTGNNKQDWRVRDIPLVVYVKDMPLGKLLQAIADCAHVRLTAEKIANAKDDKPAYRLHRNKGKEDELTAGLDARAKAQRETAEWAWDTLVKYASMPDASADVPPITPIDPNAMSITIKDEVAGEQIRLVALALASLGPTARTKAMAGEQMTVPIGSSGPLKNLFDYVLKRPFLPMMRGKPVTPTEAEMQEAILTIKVHRQDRPDRSAGFGMYVYGIPMESDFGSWHGRHSDMWNAEPVLCAKTQAKVKKLKLPPPPDTDAVWHDTPPSGFKALKEEADYTIDLLKSKVKLAAQEAGKISRAEALKSIAEVADIDIIYEDFQSHKLGHYTNVKDSGAEVPVSTVLKDMGKGPFGLDWLIDDKAKVMIGWAWEWRKSHLSLVSQGFRDNLIGKCRRATGAELDDLAPMWGLTRDQVTEWFAETPDLPAIFTDGPLAAWRLFSVLSPEDKLLVHSEAGLPLAKFDPGWLLDHFQKCKEEREYAFIRFRMPDANDPISVAENKYLNIESIGKLVLRVVPTEVSHWTIRPLSPDGNLGFERYTSPPDGPKKHTWRIELTDPAEPEAKNYLGGEWQDVCFPVYTPERDAELRKKAELKRVENTEPLKR